MLLYPALMVNEPHKSQELVCFNPWRLYYESMMIWHIGLLHYISIILFSLSCYWISISVPSRPSWNPLDILWQPHWYFSWFLIFAQQERSKCSGLSCPHYISPIKQLDAAIFLPHLPLEATALPHYSTLRNREHFYFYFILLNTVYWRSVALPFLLCAAYLKLNRPSWITPPWPVLVTRSIPRKQVQPILAPCCVEAPGASPYTLSSSLIWSLSNTSKVYISWLRVCVLMCLTIQSRSAEITQVRGIIFQPYCKHI